MPLLQLSNKKITVEIKSLNSKGLDLNVRIPSVYREMELGLRNQIALKLERGKIDFSLFVEATGEDTSSKLNVRHRFLPPHQRTRASGPTASSSHR